MKPQTPVGRALKLLPVAFIAFFVLSSLRGYVQPQWVIVACFGAGLPALHLCPAAIPARAVT